MFRLYFLLLASVAMFFSCADSEKNCENKLLGTWQLESVINIENGDTTLTEYNNGVKGIKMFNKTDFAFFQHDLNMGADSNAIFVSGGGTYQLNGSKYVEQLEYCNYREYENNTFEFELEFKDNKIIQQGVEELPDKGIKRYIIETYSKIK